MVTKVKVLSGIISRLDHYTTTKQKSKFKSWWGRFSIGLELEDWWFAEWLASRDVQGLSHYKGWMLKAPRANPRDFQDKSKIGALLCSKICSKKLFNAPNVANLGFRKI